MRLLLLLLVWPFPSLRAPECEQGKVFCAHTDQGPGPFSVSPVGPVDAVYAVRGSKAWKLRLGVDYTVRPDGQIDIQPHVGPGEFRIQILTKGAAKSAKGNKS